MGYFKNLYLETKTSELSEEEMAMAVYDHVRADELDTIQDQEYRWGEQREEVEA